MIYLTKKQVICLHEAQIKAFGGLIGIRDEGILDSALKGVRQTFGDAQLYPSAIDKITRTAYNLICGHAFVDGNKRIGTCVLLALLDLNNIQADFSNEDIIKIGTSVANNEMSYKQLLNYVKKHIS